MTNNKKKNHALIIAAIFLFLALFNGWPYGFFTLLRFTICVVSAYVAWMTYQEHKEKWTWIFGSIALLYNPIIPIYLSRGLWIFIDLAIAVFMIYSISALRLGSK